MAGETGEYREGPSPPGPLIPFPEGDPGDPIYKENGPFLHLLNCFSANAIVALVVLGPLRPLGPFSSGAPRPFTSGIPSTLGWVVLSSPSRSVLYIQRLGERLEHNTRTTLLVLTSATGRRHLPSQASSRSCLGKLRTASETAHVWNCTLNTTWRSEGDSQW